MLKIAFKSIYAHPLPEGHRFPMMKYELIPGQLLHEGIIAPENIFEPEPAGREVILLTHDKAYVENLTSLSLDPPHIRRIGFPLTKELVERELCIMQGTTDCALFALKYGVSLNVAGGTHHAFSNKGEGFCLLNDLAVAANYLLHKKLARKILIVDLDVHQGNGTAEIFRNDKRVFTFSMHGRNNYPFFKEMSDLDVAINDGTGDEEYLETLGAHLPLLISRHEPDLVFYQSGVDILSTDKLGKISVSREGCRQRDDMVFSCCRNRGIPVVAAMGGGYSPRIADIVDAHCNTFKSAARIFFH